MTQASEPKLPTVVHGELPKDANGKPILPQFEGIDYPVGGSPAPESTGGSHEWICEDELPDGYPYDKMFQFSKLGHDGLGGVRIFPAVNLGVPESTPPVQETCPHINQQGHEWESWCMDCGKIWPNNLHTKGEIEGCGG